MDSIDKKIKNVLSKDLNEPFSYEQKIKKALYEDNNKKQLLFGFKLFRIASTVCASVLLSTGIVFAGYNIYEKIWKEPTQYNSYQDYQADSELKKKNDEISRAIEIEKAEKNGEIISEDDAIKCANEILNELGYNIVLTSENIKYDDMDSKYSYDIYYVIKSSTDDNSGIELKLSGNGKLYSFTDRDIVLDYNINPDTITEEKAIEVSNGILSNIGLDENYTINSLNEISHYFNGEEKKEWFMTYVKNYNGVTNTYDTLRLDFYVENNETKVQQILTTLSDYEIENNEIKITEEDAIEIAKEKDRNISELEINNIETKLEFRPLNSFVYAQEKSQGTDDGLTIETQDDGNNIGYNMYNIDSNILRIVYNVKINYIVNYTDDEDAHNWKEQFGREYFIDASTGEIIGGRWGNNLY